MIINNAVTDHLCRNVKMAFLISNRKLVRLLCVLTTSLCVWVMYYLYQTQFIQSKSSVFLVQELEPIFTGSSSRFTMVESTYLLGHGKSQVDKTVFSKAAVHVFNSTSIISNKHLGKSTHLNQGLNRDKSTQEMVANQKFSKHLTQEQQTKTSVVGSSFVQSKKRGKSTRSSSVPPSVFPPSDLIESDNGYLVYLCDSGLLCGGWGDRQRGLTSLYFASRLVGRQFKIIMTTPCDLPNFYQPNKVDWQINASEVSNLSSQIVNAMNNNRLLTDIMYDDFNQMFPGKVVYIRANADLYERMKKNSLYTQMIKRWTGLADNRERFRWAWHELMRPSRQLLKHLEHIVGSSFLIRKGLITEPVVKNPKVKSIYDVSNSTLVCGHVRIGKNPTIPMDEDLSNFKITDLPTLHEFMLAKGHASANPYYFVAADYDYVREKSRAFFGDRLIDYGGKIIHIDRQRNGQRACVGLEVALMDQLLLSLCDVLVFCKSGFSRYASFLNNSTENIYMLENGQINKHNFTHTISPKV